MNIVNSLLSINFTSGREGHNIKNIVLHTMAGTVSGRDSYFKSPDAKISDHYGIGLNGDITRWVAEGDTAWQTDNWIDYNNSGQSDIPFKP